MASSAEQMRRYQGPALFSFGFRPFFLGGAVIAALIPLATALMLGGALDLGLGAGVLAWHGHEMIYGYLSAVVAGFILTAVPNWTGRLPLMGAPLAGLVGLWLGGRAAMLMSGAVGDIAVGVIDSSFLFMLDFFLWREVLAGKNWRNAPVCLLVLLFAAGNAIWHINVITGAGGVFGLHFGIGVIAVLLSLIGGRIVPSFTRNWLVKTGREAEVAPFSILDKLAIGATVLSMASWLSAPSHPVAGVLLVVAGLLHFVRLARWRGWRTSAEPIVAILHIGYFWLATAIVLLGVAILNPSALPASSAMHALTAGAMGVMTLAVMTRATRGHTGRAIAADRATMVIYALANLGALLRVAAPVLPVPYTTVILVAGLVWGAAFALFAIVYGRYLLSPRLIPA